MSPTISKDLQLWQEKNSLSTGRKRQQNKAEGGVTMCCDPNSYHHQFVSIWKRNCSPLRPLFQILFTVSVMALSLSRCFLQKCYLEQIVHVFIVLATTLMQMSLYSQTIQTVTGMFGEIKG